MRALLLCVAALVAADVSSAAQAQTQQQTERARRAAHLPFVRAATNCIANVVLSHPDALDAYRSDTLDRLVMDGIEQCGPALRRMADAHDRIYGAGTGFQFTTGPYHDGLDQAVLARVRPVLARRTPATHAAAVRAASQRREQVARLQRTRDVLRERLYACTNRELARLARSNEAATVLAEAAMTICRREIDDAVQAHVEYTAASEGCRPEIESLGRAIFLAAARRGTVRSHGVRAECDPPGTIAPGHHAAATTAPSPTNASISSAPNPCSARMARLCSP